MRGAMWVCEDHANLQWGDESYAPNACQCGGAGASCPACNPCDDEHPSKMPAGYRTFLDRDDGAVN
jgi:hypothetical protein